MGFFSGLIASGLYGLAIGRFHRKRYENVVRLLEKACKLDPSYDESELYHSYLGRSYLAVGRYMVALRILSRAYELFSKRKAFLQGDFEHREFVNTLVAFGDVLQKVDQLDRAREIASEAQEYMNAVKKTTGAG